MILAVYAVIKPSDAEA